MLLYVILRFWDFLHEEVFTGELTHRGIKEQKEHRPPLQSPRTALDQSLKKILPTADVQQVKKLLGEECIVDRWCQKIQR